MNLNIGLLQAIQRYLDSAPPEMLIRGRTYFIGRHVLELQCIEPGRLWTALVRGGDDYKVGLELADGDFAAECSCPVGWDCKHIVAALLELRQNESKRYTTANADTQRSAAAARAEFRLERIREAARRRWDKLKYSSLPAEPSSKLRDQLVRNLGRPLRALELEFLRLVQSHYETARRRPLTESELIRLAGTDGSVEPQNPWTEVDLWPEFPPDDYSFWLCVAWELRRRNVPWPTFMDGITEFSSIETAMRDWDRKKELVQWRNWFDQFSADGWKSEPASIEVRLMLLEDEARLQWRSAPNSPFADLKRGRVRELADKVESGAWTIASSSLSLWSVCYRPWHHAAWWSFSYDNHLVSTLYRILVMDLPPNQIVTADGQPLRRVAEPLQLALRPPDTGNPDYRLTLCTHDGSPIPRIIRILPGNPTLYLTEEGLFRGPSSEIVDPARHRGIPSQALETTEGVRFLQANGIPLPEPLSHRVRAEPVTVTLECKLQPPYFGAKDDDIVITVRAEAPGMQPEKLTPDGWSTYGRANHRQRESSAKKKVICVFDRTQQRQFPRLLQALDLKWSGFPPEWRLRLTKKTVEPFVGWLKSLPPNIDVLLAPELATLRDEPLSATISLDVAESEIDWFDLKVSLKVNDLTLTPEELKLLLNARGGYVRLGKKGWRRLQLNLTPEENEDLARLGLNPTELSGEPQRFHVLQLADESAKKFLGPDRVEKIRRRVDALKLRVAPPLPCSIRAEMRPYQTEGFHFLAYLASNRFGGVLADDMGLGKTLQTLAWLAWLRSNHSKPSCSLVVCPKSVMDNWRSETERFYPELHVQLWRSEPGAELSAARAVSDLIVINYAQLRGLSPDIEKLDWFAVILDEAQYIKNPDSQTAEAARGLRANHRLALTGTPIENRLLDLWSIFGFAMPGVLGNRTHFLRRFNAKDDPLARRRLAARVRPFLLRRTKNQVALDLPDRAEEDLLCEMEGRQETLYRAELKRTRQMLLGLKTNQQLNKERFTILTSLLRLRQICCHPGLVDAKLRNAQSAKLDALDDLIEPLMEEGHKVLVFSQFVTMLDLIRQTLNKRNWAHFYLAGDTENRGELVQRFQSAKGGAVFLISLRAGGFGLNLTAASYVVLFDPWWNPAVENQAIDRTHRIGQSSKVMAYRLLIRDSIEQKIRSLQKQKAALADDVLGEERFAQSLTLDDLKFLFAD